MIPHGKEMVRELEYAAVVDQAKRALEL